MLTQTLKGFRDFLPKEARKREYVKSTLKKVFSSYGFEPLETPALEYEEILAGKYGDEGDKLMYRFKDLGGRRVAMRYDQTVPLARVIAQYANDIPLPFKRYQIQNVWRAENTQKGRYREFLQVDIDTVGSSSPLADVEILDVVNKSFKELGISIKINFNSREVIFDQLKSIDIKEDFFLPAIRVLDKTEKVGWNAVLKELKKIEGLGNNNAMKIFGLRELTQAFEGPEMNIIWKKAADYNIPLEWRLTLARGLDYYTGIIFEVVSDNYKGGSLGGGGRYDDLIGMFSNQSIPAVGFSFGIDRIIEAMDEQSLFDGKDLGGTKVLVTNTAARSAQIANELRGKNIKVELYIDDKELDKQLRYADKKQIPFVLLVKDDKLQLKNMKSGQQKEVSLDQLPRELQ